MSGRVQLAVTTSARPHPELVLAARERADRWGLPFIARAWKEPLGPMLERAAEAFLVLGSDGLALTDEHGTMRYSPGMGVLRVKRFGGGPNPDALLRWSELKPGDSILDCTLGLAADALVAARAVGPGGRVVGLEKSLPLYALASEGLATWPYHPESARVEVIHADALEYLSHVEPGSFDCVLIDPMFDRPRASTPSFDMLRRYAESAPFPSAALHRAARVARRWVLIKAASHGRTLRKLHLQPERGGRHSEVAWARIPGSG